MTAEPYRGVRLVLADADASFCKTVSSAVFPLGMRDIAVCHDGGHARSATSSTVDVVACDTKLPDLEFRNFAQDIRQGRVGANPFVVLIATVRDEDEAKTERIAECGVDELMVKPINPLMLIRRIGALAKDRKGFVATPGYVGPSRRAARRNDGSDDTANIAVPNTLRARMIEQKDFGAIDASVAAGRKAVEEVKAASGIAVLARLTRQLVEAQGGTSPLTESKRLLRELARMALQLSVEYKKPDVASHDLAHHLPSIAEHVANLALRLEPSPSKPSKAEVELLGKLSDAAQAATSAGAKASDALPEIVAAVDRYLAKK